MNIPVFQSINHNFSIYTLTQTFLQRNQTGRHLHLRHLHHQVRNRPGVWVWLKVKYWSVLCLHSDVSSSSETLWRSIDVCSDWSVLWWRRRLSWLLWRRRRSLWSVIVCLKMWSPSEKLQTSEAAQFLKFPVSRCEQTHTDQVSTLFKVHGFIHQDKIKNHQPQV